MVVLCVFGQHNYGDPRRGGGYEYTNFIPALRRLGHDVLFLESWNRTSHRDFRELNAALLTIVEQRRPDVIFSVMSTYEIWLETWEILRDAGIGATVGWATDDSWQYRQYSRLVAPAFHAFTTTCPAAYGHYHSDGISRVLLTQWAANGSHLQPPLAGAECQYPVSFVGTAHGKRRAWINALRRNGIDVACFGHGWPRGAVAAADIPQIIRSSIISLNLANSAGTIEGIRPRETNQIKARTFEVPGAGGFLLTEWTDCLDYYYTPGTEIAVFHSLDELISKIRYYLAHNAERDAIAVAGYDRTRIEHTYERRFAEVIDFAIEQRQTFFSTRRLQPAGKIAWDRFDQASQRHNINLPLTVLRRAMVAGCSSLWGRVRAPRAARRILFELSWRLVGAHTYSAAGWPGRMFYHDS